MISAKSISLVASDFSIRLEGPEPESDLLLVILVPEEERKNRSAAIKRCSDSRFFSAGAHPVGGDQEDGTRTPLPSWTRRCFCIVACMIILRNYGRKFVKSDDQLRLVLSVSSRTVDCATSEQ